jgi:hypothetical protein
MEYFSVMKYIQNMQNPDENPDLPMDFENINEIYPSTKSLTLLSNVCEKETEKILGKNS